MTYTFLVYTTFLIYLFFGIYVYKLNKRSIINQSFLVSCLNLSTWALGYALMNSAENREAAFFGLVVSALGYCFFFSSQLYFSLMLTTQGEIFRKKWFRAAIYLPSALFFYNYTKYPTSGFVKMKFGWVYLYPLHSGWEIAFNFY